jgi:hypothetical protein
MKLTIIILESYDKNQRLNKDYYARNEKTKSTQDEVINAALDTYISTELIKDIKKHMNTESDLENSEW